MMIMSDDNDDHGDGIMYFNSVNSSHHMQCHENCPMATNERHSIQMSKLMADTVVDCCHFPFLASFNAVCAALRVS